MIKRILIALLIASGAFFSYSHVGWLIATYDYKFGTPKYYFYGLYEVKKSKFLKEKLKEKNINAVFGGCLVGGFIYEHKMIYNKVIESHLPSKFFEDLSAELKSMPPEG
jgi:hypothetical protein